MGRAGAPGLNSLRGRPSGRPPTGAEDFSARKGASIRCAEPPGENGEAVSREEVFKTKVKSSIWPVEGDKGVCENHRRGRRQGHRRGLMLSILILISSTSI